VLVAPVALKVFERLVPPLAHVIAAEVLELWRLAVAAVPDVSHGRGLHYHLVAPASALALLLE